MTLVIDIEPLLDGIEEEMFNSCRLNSKQTTDDGCGAYYSGMISMCKIIKTKIGGACRGEAVTALRNNDLERAQFLLNEVARRGL